MRPLLLLEINEVPWRVIDRFTGSGFRAIDHFFRNSRTLTNIAVDSGELSPWVTWPTFHRGLTKEEHEVKNLGQDPSTFRGTPIWEEFRRRGYPIGIFGSLQSWPPIDPGDCGFYVPDTFAHDASCIPSSLEPLQRFNLRQTASNGRVVDSLSIFSKETFQLIKCLSFLRARTIAAAVGQLAGEIWDRTRVSRRPIFQTILMWDAFKVLFDCTKPPAFSTFFTNHVAGVMHRYWNNIFPDDFRERYSSSPTRYLSTMKFAMAMVDRILAAAMSYCERNPKLIVVFASSMGQAAIDRSDSEGVQLALRDFAKLAACMQLDRSSYRELLAMEPQTAIQITDGEIRNFAILALKSCKTVSGRTLFKVEEIGNSISITMGLPRKIDIEAGRWKIGDASYSWSEGGIRVDHVEPGTAYHVKEGAMAVYGAEIEPNLRRQLLRADQAKDYLLEIAQLDISRRA